MIYKMLGIDSEITEKVGQKLMSEWRRTVGIAGCRNGGIPDGAVGMAECRNGEPIPQRKFLPDGTTFS